MEGRLMPLLTILISAVVVFIIGQILGRKTECVILYKKWDAWVLTIWGWTFIIWIICSMTSLLGNNSITVFMVLFAVFGVALLITSVISNLHHGWLSVIYIIVSILMKCIFFVFSPLNSFILLLVMFSGAQDARYWDGTKGNARTRNLWRFFNVFRFLIYDLIKPEDEKWSFIKDVFHKAGAYYDE